MSPAATTKPIPGGLHAVAVWCILLAPASRALDPVGTIQLYRTPSGASFAVLVMDGIAAPPRIFSREETQDGSALRLTESFASDTLLDLDVETAAQARLVRVDLNTACLARVHGLIEVAIRAMAAREREASR